MSEPKCFVVMPFGEKPIPVVARDRDRGTGNDRGECQRAYFDFDKVYRVVMQPAIRAAGFEPVRADESSSSGLIHSEMFTDLRDQEVVLVDLSLHNPNVFYELGIRHVMAQRGTVLMCEQSTSLPFDVQLSRVIKYHYDGNSFDYEEAERVKPLVTSALREATSQPDSPVHAMLDRVLQEDTAQVEMGHDTRIAFAEKEEVLRSYARVIAGTWRKNANIDRLMSRHSGSRLGVLALAEFCLNRDEMPKGADRIAARLRVYSQYELSTELFDRLVKADELEPWRYMQYGSALSEADPDLAGARRGLEIQEKGLRLARSAFKTRGTDENRWNYAYCLHHVGSLNGWIWRCSGREDAEHLDRAISILTESASVVGDRPPPWLNFALRTHLKLLYFHRARDGRAERAGDEVHLKAILGMKAPADSPSSVRSSVGWYQVVAHVERGNKDASRREAIRQLDRDAEMAARDKTFARVPFYFLMRRFMRDNAEYQRYPRLWEQIAQLMKDASSP